MKRQISRKLNMYLIAILLASCQNDELTPVDTGLIVKTDEHFVTLRQAKQIATRLKFASNPIPSPIQTSQRTSDSETGTKEIDSVFEVPDENGLTSLYIINYVESGFIMIAGDDRSEPIKAFSEVNSFSLGEDDYPSELVYWLLGTNEQIEDIRELDGEQTEGVAELWEGSTMQQVITGLPQHEDDTCQEYDNYGPLMSTNWGQGIGYNNQAPILGCFNGNLRALTGCVATAMAQVMRYHEFPNNFDWINMHNSQGTPPTARLMRDIGDAVDMDWGCDVSGADTKSEAASSFRNDFGYSSATYSGYNLNTVKAEIRAGRPVLLRGGRRERTCFIICFNSYTNGHAWVCDGYRSVTPCNGVSSTLLHMNWGWDGRQNGYYSTNNWSPGNNSFNYERGMVYNIRP